MRLNTEVSVLLRATQAATAAVTALYEDTDIDVAEVVGDADPLATIWAIAFMTSALLRSMAPEHARALLATWGGRIARSAANHPGPDNVRHTQERQNPMQDEQHDIDIPQSAAGAVAAHAEAAGDGAHTPLHSHVDDARVAEVAERFERPSGTELQAPER